jgi:hypothetical protein
MDLRAAFGRSIARLLAFALLPASLAGLTAVGASAPAAADNGCQLRSADGAIKHVINIVFDNTHFTRDNPNVPSDVEQMPHLLNFLTSNGTLFTNHHAVLISHTAGDILSSLTGLYPDRQGQTVSNSYFYFDPTSTPANNPAFSISFKYWTDLVDDSTGTRDPLPNMVFDNQKTTPAPWVPYTRAGCDVGAAGAANIVLENTRTGAFGDMTQVFGAGSPEWDEAVASNAAPPGTAARALAQTDFVGMAIHCAAGGGICSRNAGNARADKLPDEPGGYVGFQGLFGAKYVNPAITDGQPAVNNTNGQPITDPFGQPGFPGFDGMLAKSTLGYVAQMQEAGVPVTYAYISDAHDNHDLSRSSGPGEADYRAQLAAYDDAFAKFFDRLAGDGITKDNTLFVFTSDEGDHFAGGTGTPQPDGTLAYTHANCSNLSACPSNQIGEVNLNIKPLLPGAPAFSVHNDSSPAFYVNGNPDRTDSTLRKLQRDVGNLAALDPYVSTSPTPVFVAMADKVGEKALHMVNSDPARTPSFTAFGNPDYFISASGSGPFCGANPCIDYHFAWSHGDIQQAIAVTWLGLVGPGVQSRGVDAQTWSDHTNIRPTVQALIGLKDSYTLDGRVLIEGLTGQAIPPALAANRDKILRLGADYEQLNASFGQFAMDILRASTRALKSGSADDDSLYASIESSIEGLTARRDALAGQIKAGLNAAAFTGQPISEDQAGSWIDQAESLLNQARDLAGG